jgi:hypothetical protein
MDHTPCITADDLDNVPGELRELVRWVPWKVQRNNAGQFKKVPCNADGYPVDCNKPVNWLTFAQARGIVRNKPSVFGGVGLCFAPDADGKLSGYVAWDLDACRDPGADQVAQWAIKIENALNTYTELSPSGTGLRIIARATGLSSSKRMDRAPAPLTQLWKGPGLYETEPLMANTGGKNPAVECFFQGGYVTVTGRHWITSRKPCPIRD